MRHVPDLTNLAFYWHHWPWILALLSSHPATYALGRRHGKARWAWQPAAEQPQIVNAAGYYRGLQGLMEGTTATLPPVEDEPGDEWADELAAMNDGLPELGPLPDAPFNLQLSAPVELTWYEQQMLHTLTWSTDGSADIERWAAGMRAESEAIIGGQWMPDDTDSHYFPVPAWA